jgi:hypothetical protein
MFRVARGVLSVEVDLDMSILHCILTDLQLVSAIVLISRMAGQGPP